MHNPAQAAHIQAPLGNATNNGLAAKALLAKRTAKAKNPKFVSPTDNLLTPVTQKLNAAKQKRFQKSVEPMGQLGCTKDASSDEDSVSDTEMRACFETGQVSEGKTTTSKLIDEESPF